MNQFTSAFRRGAFGGGVFTGSSVIPGVHITGTVDTFSVLPLANSQFGLVWLVRFDEPEHLAGLYYSNGIIWDRLGLESTTEVKILYESNPNTNAFTDQEKVDLASNSSHRTIITGNPHGSIAIDIPFNNIASGLAAIEVQAAIDEIDANLDGLDAVAVKHVSGTVIDNVIPRYDGTTGLFIKAGHAVSITNSNDIEGVNLVDGRDVSVDGTKLDGIESNAKDDQIAIEVPYDNSSSGLAAINVQAAMDEVEVRTDNLEAISHAAITLNGDAPTQGTLNLVGQELQINLVTISTDGAMSAIDKVKLNGIEALAEVNNISDANASLLTGIGDATTLHHHDSVYYTKTLLDGGQLDNRYFTEVEHINSSVGVGSASIPIILNASGLIDPSMLIFGTQYQDLESLGASAITGTLVFQEKLSLVTPAIPAGTYVLDWSYAWNYSIGTRDFIARIQQDDVTDIMNHQAEPKDPQGDQLYRAAGKVKLVLTADSYQFDLDYAVSNTNDTATISDARLFLWRVA